MTGIRFALEKAFWKNPLVGGNSFSPFFATTMVTSSPLTEAQVCAILERIQEGDASAKEELFRLLYTELYGRARRQVQGQPLGISLQATELVNEAYLRLGGSRGQGWRSRQHFLATASLAMRHVLIDYFRKRNRRSNRANLEVEELAAVFEDRSIDLEALDLALSELREADPEMAQAVDLRFFGGVGVEETAKILDIKLRTFGRARRILS